MSVYFVVSDIHGFYDEMIQALNKKGFNINNPNHVFVSLGDLLDRGPQANECLDFVNGLPDNRKILIKGNHEDLMEQAICRHYFGNHDYHNRTNDSCYQLTGLYPDTASEEDILKAMKSNIKWNTYINSCIDYYETDNCIFVHGWIPCFDKWGSTYYNMPDWRNASKEDWERARWLNGFEAWEKGIREEGKTIYCGHWGTDYGHKYLHNEQTLYTREDIWLIIDFAPNKYEEILKKSHREFKDDGIVGLDASTVVSGFVNCVKINKQPPIILK